MVFRPAVGFAFLLSLCIAGSALAHQHEYSETLGDGKVSAQPQVGYIWSCQQQFSSNAPGAQVVGPWIHDGKWYPDQKIHVQGDVAWPNSSVAISVENGARVIRANNLPKHGTGIFPIQQTDPAFKIDRNPNTITTQNVLLTLPLAPVAAAQQSCVPMGMIGFALTGTAIFSGLDAGGRDAAAHEVLDKCDGHPPPDGQYHYHRYSDCMADAAGKAGHHSDLVGYALDGFGIYGLHGENGGEITNAELDACHGHTHTVMWNGKMQSVYHYHMTGEYPYSLGCFKGTPVQVPQSANAHGGGQRRGPPNQGMAAPTSFGEPGIQNQNSSGGGQQPPKQPPGGDKRQLIMKNAASTLGVDENTLRDAVGPPPPDFNHASQKLGIPAETIRAAFDKARGQ